MERDQEFVRLCESPDFAMAQSSRETMFVMANWEGPKFARAQSSRETIVHKGPAFVKAQSARGRRPREAQESQTQILLAVPEVLSSKNS